MLMTPFTPWTAATFSADGTDLLIAGLLLELLVKLMGCLVNPFSIRVELARGGSRRDRDDRGRGGRDGDRGYDRPGTWNPERPCRNSRY